MFPTVVPVRFAMARNERPRNQSSTRMFFASSNILVTVLLPLSVKRRTEAGTLFVAARCLPVTICSAPFSIIHVAVARAPHGAFSGHAPSSGGDALRKGQNVSSGICGRAARSLCAMSDFYSGKSRLCSTQTQVLDDRPIASAHPTSYHYSNDDMCC